MTVSPSDYAARFSASRFCKTIAHFIILSFSRYSSSISRSAPSYIRASGGSCAGRAKTRHGWLRSVRRFAFSALGWIAGAVGGRSGFLLANATEFVSPAYMSWQRSGELIIMILLGGLGTLHGAIVGAAAYLLIEETLGGITEQWKLIFGPLLVLIVLFARGGLLGLVDRIRGRPGRG